MKSGFRTIFANACVANQTALAGTALLSLAFTLIAANALFNQSGRHPLPLSGARKSLITNAVDTSAKIDVPLRRVTTRTFAPLRIPVPVPRSQIEREIAANTPVPDERPDVESTQEQIQRLLARLGFYGGPVDGLIGAKTRTAINNFEKSRNFAQIGKATPQLLAQLKAAIAPKAGQKNRREHNGHSEPATLTSKYDVKLVTRVQVGLINFGNRDISIDGVMGNQTRLAIEKFQKRFDLKVNGEPSQALVSKLEDVGALTPR